jgi:hypothetical protein
MLDDLRNSASSPFLDNENFEKEEQLKEAEHHTFLGMTPAQRFVISLFLFFMILILGGFLLILFQKVYPPV